jgi:hypothetical protein
MRRTGNLYDRIAEPENLRRAFWKARRGKSGKADVLSFAADLEANLAAMRDELLAEDVRVGEYRYFTVFDPKERRICAAAFRERVLHHAVMNVCEPAFERYQVWDSYACRKGKGTVTAVERASVYCRRLPWYLKLDVRKYFDSIDHAILKASLMRLFKDSRLLRLLDRIVDSYTTAPGKGVPIGNLASQYFANHILARVDHACRDTMRIEGYVRYMDDMVLWGRDGEALLRAGAAVERLVREDLRLALKPVCLNRCAAGLPFLGYLIYPHQLRLSSTSRRRYAARLHEYYDALVAGECDQAEFAGRVSALVAFTERAVARGFRRAILSDFGCCPRARTA